MRLIPLLLAVAACEPTVLDLDVPEVDETDPVVEPEEPVDLAEAVTLDALLDHLAALQNIADANNGNRVYLSAGYLDSVDYVVDQLEDAGLSPVVEEYTISRWALGEYEALVMAAPGEPLRPLEIEVFPLSAGGEVEARVIPIDVVIPAGDAPNTSTSGCEADDFAEFGNGNIALIQRGTCTFATKVANAQAAGALAVIIFNEGQAGRTDVLSGTLDRANPPVVPVVGLSYADGVDLVEIGPVGVRVSVDAEVIDQVDRNVLVEIAGTSPERVVTIGSHLDSVAAGSGINDNGSGSAFVLELARQAKLTGWEPATTVRFGFWGAEEQGLIGSRNHFLTADNEANPAATDGLEAYLNFDMMASSNGARFVYDGDGSDINDGLSTPGSAAIEALFLAHFEERELVTSATGLEIPTDSYWTAALGIPTGGLFSGAFEEKTRGEAALQGGEAFVAYDVCYHRECDRIDQINETLYGELMEAATVVAQTLGEAEVAPSGAPPEALLPNLPETPHPVGCHERAVPE